MILNLLITINILVLLLSIFLVKELCNYYLIKSKTLFSPRIIVSMTTSPKRIYSCKHTIDTILNQTVPVDYIHINLPHVFKRDNSRFTSIPEFLTNNPKVVLNMCEDLGPATKIVPTVKSNFTNYSDIIISIDDDTSYPPNLVEHLVYYHSFYPNAVLTGTSLFSNKTSKYIDTLLECELLEGFSGVLYKKRFLEDIPISLFDKASVPIYHYLSDDLVLSNYLCKKRIKILCLTANNNAIKNLKQFDYGFKGDALHKGATGIAGCQITAIKDCNNQNYVKTIKYLKQKGEYYLSRDYYV